MFNTVLPSNPQFRQCDGQHFAFQPQRSGLIKADSYPIDCVLVFNSDKKMISPFAKTSHGFIFCVEVTEPCEA